MAIWLDWGIRRNGGGGGKGERGGGLTLPLPESAFLRFREQLFPMLAAEKSITESKKSLSLNASGKQVNCQSYHR